MQYYHDHPKIGQMVRIISKDPFYEQHGYWNHYYEVKEVYNYGTGLVAHLIVLGTVNTPLDGIRLIHRHRVNVSIEDIVLYPMHNKHLTHVLTNLTKED